MLHDELKELIELRKQTMLTELENRKHIVDNIDGMFKTIMDRANEMFGKGVQFEPQSADEFTITARITDRATLGRDGFSAWVYVYVDSETILDKPVEELDSWVLIFDFALERVEVENEETDEKNMWDEYIGYDEEWSMKYSPVQNKILQGDMITEDHIQATCETDEVKEIYRKFAAFVNSFQPEE